MCFTFGRGAATGERLAWRDAHDEEMRAGCEPAPHATYRLPMVLPVVSTMLLRPAAVRLSGWWDEARHNRMSKTCAWQAAGSWVDCHATIHDLQMRPRQGGCGNAKA